MTNLPLKQYQEKTLSALKSYLERARFQGAKVAFEDSKRQGVVNRYPYKHIPELEDVPYICLRLPTGGGKTLLAAHTVRIAAETYLERDFPLVLWLVPSTTIREQTIETLKSVGHPNHDTLYSSFDGAFSVLDITDFTSIRPQDLKAKALIIVGTVQTIKTEEANTDSRKAYAHNEHLEPLFTQIPINGVNFKSVNFDTTDNGSFDKNIRFSFINLLRMHRPLVIVDEAHNNATKLGLELFKRINAACVVEFTATPASDSNVLHSVSATELKAEEMIKLPILLSEQKTWEEAVRDAILCRKRLEDLCQHEDRYIRPIILFQAEPQNKDTTWQVLKKHLIEVEQIPEAEIAVVTGDQRELDGINLFDPTCPICYVITVQALKEGWDCSFAYVFCSVANINSAKDVEQILGRVLRMPYAKRRKHPDLNRAYAFVSRTSWPNAVEALQDRLVRKMGFEREEVEDSLHSYQGELPLTTKTFANYDLPPAVSFEVQERPDLPLNLFGECQGLVVTPLESGLYNVKVKGAITEEVSEKVIACVSANNRAVISKELANHQRTVRTVLPPASCFESFSLPQLALRFGDFLTTLDTDSLLYCGGWKLEGCAKLDEQTFSLKPDGQTFSIDIEDGKMRYAFVAEASQLNLDVVDMGYTLNNLAYWLDRRLRQPDIAQPLMLSYLRKTLEWLLEERKIPLPTLARGKFLLQKVLDIAIRREREAAKKRGFEQVLFKLLQVEISSEHTIRFDTQSYHPNRLYSGSFKPKKHFYPVIGEMNSEELECAKAIEMLGDDVRYWVRNLENDKAFRLPTATDFFYPDFIAVLNSGQFLIIEYKGSYLETSEDTKEKVMIGELWAKLSGNLFSLVTKQDAKGRSMFEQVKQVII
jgi:type III restriction enzyme